MNYYKYTMDMKAFNVLSIILFIPLFFIICILELWGYIDIYFLVLYFLWMFLHELLHGIGFSLNKSINNKNIVYGACLEKGILYCMCKQEISKKSIIISLLFPFMFIGIITFFVGLVINNSLLQLLSLFNIIGCIGDLVMFWYFVKLPNFSYVDLDDCTSFVLISEFDLSKYKIYGLKLTQSGCYNDLGKANDYRKFNVSKLSLLVFLVLILILFVKIISSFLI